MDRPAQKRDDIRSRGSRQYAVLLAASFAVLLASTLDRVFGNHPLWWRAAVLLFGAALAAPALARFLSGGRVRLRNRHRWLFALAGLHVIATLYFFPVEHLLDARPIVTADHAVHYAQCVRSKAVFWSSLRLDCYSPYFMAGYPAGTIFDLDMKGAEVFTALVPVHTATALKLFILFAYLTLLPSVYRGARMLGFRIEESVLGAMLLLVYWHWGRPYASDFRFVGMFSFVFATHAVLFVTGLLRRFLAGDRGRALFVLGPIAFMVHVLAVVMAVVPLATVLIVDRRRVTRRRVELLFMWVLAIVFVNALWILPLIRFLPYKTSTEAYYQLRGLGELGRLVVEPGGLVAIGIAVLALAGGWRLVRSDRVGVGAPCAAAALTMLALAIYGVYLPAVDQLEPGRFLFSALVFAAPLSGVGATWLIGRLARWAGAARSMRLRGAILVGLALAPLLLSMLDAKAYYRHTLSVRLPPHVERLRVEILSVVNGEGRLMIEEGSARAYEGTFLPALLPSQTGVEQIGGPFPHTPIVHHTTSFDETSCLGRPFASWTPDAIAARLRFLRVRWIVTATDGAARFAASIPGATLRWSDGPLRFWDLPADPGAVRVHATYDEIRADLEVGSRPVVLPYHWLDGLHTARGNEIVPVYRDDDPVPFICVRRVRVTPVTIAY